MAAALEAFGAAPSLLWLVSWQWCSSVPCDSWWGHEPRGDSNVQRPGKAEPGCHSCHLLFVLLFLPLPIFPGLLHYQWTLLSETTGILPGGGAEAGGGDPTGLRTGGQYEEHWGTVGAGAALRKPAGDRQAQNNWHQLQGWALFHTRHLCLKCSPIFIHLNLPTTSSGTGYTFIGSFLCYCSFGLVSDSLNVYVQCWS